MSDGYRESEQSWKELLLDLKQRGLSIRGLLTRIYDPSHFNLSNALAITNPDLLYSAKSFTVSIPFREA